MRVFKMNALIALAAVLLGAGSGTMPAGAEEHAAPTATKAQDGTTPPVAVAPDSAAAEALPPLQTLCPIMGNEIDRTVFIDYEGQRIYFCCPPCIEKFNEDPAGHVAKMKAAGIRLHPTPQPQTLCPVMGEPIDQTVFTDHEGQRIYFCCQPCVTKFLRDPGPYMKILAEQGVTLEPAPAAKSEPDPAAK